MARKKAETKNEEITEEVIQSTDTAAKLTCAIKGRQFVYRGTAIRYGEEVAIEKPYSSELQSRIHAGFIKEVN
ncbi:hypothetical protein [Enterococcus xiangfangensis]|uniref:Uncharacterized protein n=1 Tax=Enterococcus xiangfangensis TaxID=1296537 RepID=A0ABU3F9E0_9ENTE|nr:hypothetical protein [Enterococcus xiangfangensis]MDT2759274.1 hypothetical protein [Enterococcus xiangfangensis]